MWRLFGLLIPLRTLVFGKFLQLGFIVEMALSSICLVMGARHSIVFV